MLKPPAQKTQKPEPPNPPIGFADPLSACAADIRACTICRDRPLGTPLPHPPRPVLRISSTARIAVCGQAPGTRVNASGMPFTDASGVRLRAWMAVDDAAFYDASRIAIIPMGFCFPGLDAKGADRPPRRECAPTWHDRLFRLMPQLDLLLLVGAHAQRWHLPVLKSRRLSDVVADWRQVSQLGPTRTHPKVCAMPLPHPSWRNTGWLAARPWFAAELLPVLQQKVRERM